MTCSVGVVTMSKHMQTKSRKPPKQKQTVTGRTFTSRFRGVHQTFPTKRWEAQFRRGGKPTSLGCFDEEEEAARACASTQLGFMRSFDPGSLCVMLRLCQTGKGCAQLFA